MCNVSQSLVGIVYLFGGRIADQVATLADAFAVALKRTGASLRPGSEGAR